MAESLEQLKTRVRTIEYNVITLGQESSINQATVAELKEEIRDLKEVLAATNARLDQVCKEKGESTVQRNPSRKPRRALLKKG
jgi:ubiquinone biosynthesis protein UbiJ